MMKCECCHNTINEEYEELEERTMWNGKKCMCCEECCKEIDKFEEQEYTKDDYLVDVCLEMEKLGL